VAEEDGRFLRLPPGETPDDENLIPVFATKEKKKIFLSSLENRDGKKAFLTGRTGSNVRVRE